METTMNQKPKYLTKTVSFGTTKLTLFSIDGTTWSSRKEELHVIQDRHDAAKVTAAHLRGEPGGGDVEANKAAVLSRRPSPADKKKSPPGKYLHPAEQSIQNRNEALAAAEAAKAQAPAAEPKAKAKLQSVPSPAPVKATAPTKKKAAPPAPPKRRAAAKPKAKAKKAAPKKKAA